MADNPVCLALARAKEAKGWDYKTIAEKLGEPEDRVKKVFTGETKATPEEYDNIAAVLGIKDQINPQHKAATTAT